MNSPHLEIAKKKQQEKARKIKRIITVVLSLLVLGIFGGIFYFWKKEHLTVPDVLHSDKSETANDSPMGAVTIGKRISGVKYDELIPASFKDKLTYRDSNYHVHVKTDIDVNKVIAADHFADDRARILVKIDSGSKGYLYIDKEGKQIIPVNPKWEYCGPFSEGVACVEDRISGKIGFINKTGKFVIQPQFFVSPFSEGNAVHREDQLEHSNFSDGLAAVYNSHVAKPELNSCGFIDHAGRFVLPVSYLQAYPFVDQRARVLVKDTSKWKRRWGYIDKKGKYVLKPVYMREEDFSEGLAAVLDYTGKWGYIDKTGAYKIPATFAGAGSFHDGLAPAATAGSKETASWGYIKKDGSWLVEAQFDRADEFHAGTAYACNGGLKDGETPTDEYTIDKKGKVEKVRKPTKLPIDLSELNKKE